MISPAIEVLKKVPRLSSRDWSYLSIAFKELLIARVRFAAIPTQRIVADLKTQSDSECSAEQLPADAEPDIGKLAWAISAVAARLPWRADCLLQVMAAERWLNRHSIPTSFFLGVAKQDRGDFKAHAWLCQGATVVAGGSGEGFETLIQRDTADPPPSSGPV